MNMSIKNEQPTTLFAAKMVERMEAFGLETIDISDKTGATYQHIRGILKGQSFPSPFFLKELCRVLELDFTEATKLVAADKIKHKYGDIPEELAGKKPGLIPVERVWDEITPEQQEEFIKRLRAQARTNRLIRKAS
jgi:transcriptional regulator with XRE-family HTH domain